jgi:hypothetical protein
MKKIALVGLVTLCSVGAYAQGTVTFLAQSFPQGIDAQVFSPDLTNPTTEYQGDTALENQAAGNGSTGVTYSGVPIGGASYTGAAPASIGKTSVYYAYGNLFTAELYALSTTTSTVIPINTTLASLSPVTQYQSTFATGPTPYGSGFFDEANPASPDPGIPGTGFIGTVTRTRTGPAYLGNNAAAAVVAWYNGGGQFTTLAAAQAAQVPWGQSSIFEITGLTEPASVMTQDNNNVATAAQPGPTYLGNTIDYSTYLQSFSLITPVPEPSTIALGVMGACAFLARRRKK